MKLKKPSICLRVIVTMVTSLVVVTSGHTQRFSTGIVAGMNASQIDGDMLAGFDKIGFTGGLKAIINFESAFAMNVEFLYSQRGSKPDIFNPDYDPNIGINLVYAEIPVYFSLGDWWQEEGKYHKVSAQAGLSYARLITASAFDNFHPPETSIENLVPYFNDNDLSWLIGVSYRMNSHLGIMGRYTRGITPLLSPEKHDLDAPKLISYFLTFRAEYYF